MRLRSAPARVFPAGYGGRASLSTSSTCLFSIFFHLSVSAALRHNSLLARHCADNVSKDLQLALGQAGESESKAPRYEAQPKKKKKKKVLAPSGAGSACRGTRLAVDGCRGV